MFISILLALFASNSFAAESGRLTCGQDPDAPIYQLIRIDKDTFEMNAYFPWGTDNAPLFSGDVSTQALARLQFKADLVKKMGSSYKARFSVSQCRRYSQDGLYSIHCFTTQPVTINELTFPHGLSFHAAGKKVTSLDCPQGQCTALVDEQVTVGVEVGVPMGFGVQLLDFARTYSGADCKIDANFWK